MNEEKEVSQAEFRSLSRRSFLALGGAGLAATGVWWKLRSITHEDGISKPFRRVLQADQKVAQSLFSPRSQGPLLQPRPKGEELRTNGDDGLGDDFDPASWMLKLEGPQGKHSLSLAELKKIPATPLSTELRCVEGWTVNASWVGVRMLDLLARYTVDNGQPYVAMTTPDEGYYVGLDAASAMHPQTMLAWELNGEPLSSAHGAPIRLVIPVKYGVKWLKRVDKIRFTDQKPKDFWAEQGYDWYLGL